MNRKEELEQYLNRDLEQYQIDTAWSFYYTTDLTPAEIFQRIMEDAENE